MAHLTKPIVYNIEDSNVALLGSDLEKNVREKAGDTEQAWKDAGRSVGIQIWHIEKFHVVPWPEERKGDFYEGDSYIVLHTYKKTPETESFSYNLHFWLGQNTTQDEAGTAAYKTVELDDHLHGNPVQFREVQGYESRQFLSYFPRFFCLQGGVSTGFHHVSDPLPLNIRKLYRITFSAGLGSHSSKGGSNLLVREVPPTAQSLVTGDVYVLDKGEQVLQFNSQASVGLERFQAAEFVQGLVNERRSHCQVTVYDEGGPGAQSFLHEFGDGTAIRALDLPSANISRPDPALFRISDATGVATFEAVYPPIKKSLSSDEAFLLDDSGSSKASPTIYIWIGKRASLNERRLATQYAQRYLHDKKSGRAHVAVPIVKMLEGNETVEFLEAI